MMSICGFMEMNIATFRYMPIEKNDDLPSHNSTSRFPRIGTAGHNVLTLNKGFESDFRAVNEGKPPQQRQRINWEDALEHLTAIRP